jgi:hypothetical protein
MSSQPPGDPEVRDVRIARYLALSRVLLGESRDDGAVLIHYRCVTRAHLAVTDQPSGRVTAHERKWAYCNDPDAASEHEWQATGGVSVELLRIEQRRLLEVLSQKRREVNAARDALVEPRAGDAPVAEESEPVEARAE